MADTDGCSCDELERCDKSTYDFQYFGTLASRHFFFSSCFSLTHSMLFGMMKCVAIAIYRLNRQLQEFLRTFQLGIFCFSNGFAAVANVAKWNRQK